MIQKVKELYRFRGLLYNLTIKELKLKYRNSALGFFWSLLNPLLMMLIFTFVFGNVFRLGIENFPIFLLCGLFPWNFFNMSLSSATGSIVANSNLIKKIYFPREVLPISIVAANLINFLLELVVLFVFLAVYGYNFWAYLPLLLVAIAIEVVLIVGLALALAGLNVYFRDIQYIVNIFLMALFYATPILYNIKMLEGMNLVVKYPWILTIYKLNPLTAIITQYQRLLYENVWPGWYYVLFSLGAAFVFLIIGFMTFSKLEPGFAEEV